MGPFERFKEAFSGKTPLFSSKLFSSESAEAVIVFSIKTEESVSDGSLSSKLSCFEDSAVQVDAAKFDKLNVEGDISLIFADESSEAARLTSVSTCCVNKVVDDKIVSSTTFFVSLQQICLDFSKAELTTIDVEEVDKGYKVEEVQGTINSFEHDKFSCALEAE